MTIKKIYKYDEQCGYINTGNLKFNWLIEKYVKNDKSIEAFYASDIEGLPEEFRKILQNTVILSGDWISVYNNGTRDFEDLKEYSGAKVLTAEMQYSRFYDEPDRLEKYLKIFEEEYFGFNAIFIDKLYFTDEEYKFVLFHEIGHILAFHLFGMKYLSDRNNASFVRSEVAADLIALVLSSKLFYKNIEKALDLYNNAVDNIMKNVPEDADPKIVELQKRRFNKVNNFQSNEFSQKTEIVESYFK